MDRAKGGWVNGPILMDVRPVRDGEESEKLIARDGTVTDLGGILEIHVCRPECTHEPPSAATVS